MSGRGRDAAAGTGTATAVTATATTATTTTTIPATATASSAAAAAATSRHRRRLDSISGYRSGDLGDGTDRHSTDSHSNDSRGVIVYSSAMYQWFVNWFPKKKQNTVTNVALDSATNDREIGSIRDSSDQSVLQRLGVLQAQGQGLERGLGGGQGLYDVFVGTEDPQVNADICDCDLKLI